MFSRRSKHPAIGERVIVSLVSGNAIEGVMCERVGDHYVLKGCRVYEAGADPVDADGEMVIDRWQVDYTQVVRGA